MDANVSFGVDDHGQGRKVPKLGDVVNMARTATLILNHLEGRGGSGVVDAQGVRHLGISRRDCKVPRDGQVGCSQITKCVVSHSCREISGYGRIAPDRKVLRGCSGQYVQVTLDVAVAHL